MEPATVPGPDTNLASTYLILCGVLTGLAFTLCTTRIYTRLRPFYRLALDDYLIIVAETLSITGYCFGCVAASHGWGHVSAYIPLADQKIVFSCILVLQLTSLLTVALIRISVACSLMRFGNSNLWTGTLYTLIVIQTIISTVWIVIPFLNCGLLKAWNPETAVKCWPRQITVGFGWFTACMVILMDLTLATMPLKLIRSLNRPISEKILIGCLMAMGLCATGLATANAAIVKDIYHGDPLSSTVHCTTLAKLQELVGLSAACVPCLKAFVERGLRKVGIMSDRRVSMSLPSFVQPRPCSSSGRSGTMTYVNTSSSRPTDDNGDQQDFPERSKATDQIEVTETDIEAQAVMADGESFRTFGKGSKREQDV